MAEIIRKLEREYFVKKDVKKSCFVEDSEGNMPCVEYSENGFRYRMIWISSNYDLENQTYSNTYMVQALKADMINWEKQGEKIEKKANNFFYVDSNGVIDKTPYQTVVDAEGYTTTQLKSGLITSAKFYEGMIGGLMYPMVFGLIKSGLDL